MSTARVTENAVAAPHSRQAFAKRIDGYERSLPWVKVGDAQNTLRMVTPSQVCLWRALSFFEKEPETLRWIAGFAEGAVMFDVGANVGIYTLWAALTRKAEVFAFEPEAGNYSTLNTNLRLNGLTDRCLAYCMGISDSVGMGSLRVGRAAVGSSGHQVGALSRAGVSQGVPTMTLDHLVYEAGLPCPAHVKIDVDGIEPAIVRGAGRLLADSRLKSVLIELAVMHADHRAVIDAMLDYGFAKDEALERAVFEKRHGVKFTGNIVFTRDGS